MNTNFFENIASLNLPGNWRITVYTGDNETFTVSALFTALHCGDNASHAVPPMLLTGTSGELDKGFFDTIHQPVVEAAGLFHNMETYLKGVEQAKLASKAEQDRKANERKQATATASAPDKPGTPSSPKPSREELNKAYDEAMGNVTELVKKFKFSEALGLLPSADTYPHKEREIVKKQDYLKQQAKFYETALITFNQDK